MTKNRPNLRLDRGLALVSLVLVALAVVCGFVGAQVVRLLRLVQALWP